MRRPERAAYRIASVITKNMRYDAVGAFDWIGQIATAGLFIVVRPDSPYKDIKSLVAAAKANPGKIVFGSPGFAATQHLAGELLKSLAAIGRFAPSCFASTVPADPPRRRMRSGTS